MIRTRFAAVLVAVPLALAGCSGGQTPADQAAGSPSAVQGADASPTAGQEVDKNAFFADVRRTGGGSPDSPIHLPLEENP